MIAIAPATPRAVDFSPIWRLILLRGALRRPNCRPIAGVFKRSFARSGPVRIWATRHMIMRIRGWTKLVYLSSRSEVSIVIGCHCAEQKGRRPNLRCPSHLCLVRCARGN